jgi:flavin reductase (DIM6/NTAB) family NADH-FMN oxidoreductase RutF
MTDITLTPGPDTLRAYRDALACFGTGVTVVTAQSAIGPVAMTANSFASVSLDPALVLWCPSRKSMRHDAFIAAPRFAIHIMAEDQQDTARHFARSGDDFGGIDWAPDAHGLPILSGCLARFDCRRFAVHDGGDHSIVLGEVLQASFHTGKGLLFKHGEYGGFFRLG